MGLDRVGPRQGSTAVGDYRRRASASSPGVSDREPAPGDPRGGLLGGIIRAGRRAVRLRVRNRRPASRAPPVGGVAARPRGWRRAPLRLQWAAFYATASVVLRTHAGATWCMRCRPCLRWPNRVDLAIHQLVFGRLLRGGSPGGRRARVASYGGRRVPSTARPGALHVPAVSHPPRRGRDTRCQGNAWSVTTPGWRWPRIPLVYDTERYRPDPEVRKEVRAELGVAPDEVVALHSGREPRLKGLDLAVEGIAEAHRNGAARLTLWTAGTGDPEPAARRHGVAGRVKRLGFRSDMQRYHGGSRHLPCCQPFTSTDPERLARGGRVRAPARGDRQPAGRQP